ncbi:MAG: hypothetical protein P1U89_20930 [Verrucomicrobiales bacterium]|nr:hypothetical protein [Verrucomicrobiales bacterium]
MNFTKLIFLILPVFCLSTLQAIEGPLSSFSKLSPAALQKAFESDKSLINQVYEEGNIAFEKGNFSDAIQLYQLLVAGGQSSDSLYLNLGTAYFRNGSPGTAALWFRRASLLTPEMPEVRQNFEFLRRQQGLLEFSAAEWQQMLLRISPVSLQWAFWLSLWGALFSLLWLFLGKRRTFKPLYWVTLFFGGVFSIGFFWLASYRENQLAPRNFATVIVGETSALVSPAPDSDPIIGLPEGSEIRILEDTGPWIYASIPGDLVGWVHHTSIEKNWPILVEKPNFLPPSNL